jgi:pilus assembly protein Flp/PilA
MVEIAAKREIMAVICRLKTLLRNEEGASAVEYALILAFIAAAIIASVTLFGGSVKGLFETTNAALTK